MVKWHDRIGNRIEMKLYEDANSPEFEWVKGNVIKGYRYQDGIVSMKSDDGRIIWCGVETSDFRKSDESLGDFISNADRIRSMSDEELAEFLPIVFDCMCNPTDKCREVVLNHGECTKTKGCALHWLQSEVEE